MSKLNPCLLCHSPINHGIVDKSSATKILLQLYDLPIEDQGSKLKIEKGHSCQNCYNNLTEAKNLLEEFREIEQKLKKIKKKIKSKINIKNEPNSTPKLKFIFSVLNSIKNTPSNKKSIAQDDSEPETDFEDDGSADAGMDWNDNNSDNEHYSTSEKGPIPLKVEIKEECLENDDDGNNNYDDDVGDSDSNENLPSTSKNKNEKEKKQTQSYSFNKPSPKCEKCEIKFGGEGSYNLHMFNIHGIKNVKCTEDPENCKETFAKTRNLIYHIKRHHREQNLAFTCPHCSKSFFTSNSLKVHIKSHMDIMYECPDPNCDKIYKSEAEFKNHKRIHDPDFLPVYCTECGACLRDMTKLKIHMNRVHSEKKFACPQCPLKFTQGYRYREHLQTHSDERTCLCSDCGKSFKSKMSLREHSKIHINANSGYLFVCHELGCTKSYTSEGSFKKHKNLHKKAK